MATKAMMTAGVKLQRGDGATPTETFATIADVLSVKGPTETAKLVDVTSLSSTGGYREYLTGLKDGGEVSFDVSLSNDASHQGLHSDFAGNVLRNFKLLLTDDVTTPTSIAFAARVSEFSLDAAVDQQVKGSIKLKLSGAPTYSWKT